MGVFLVIEIAQMIQNRLRHVMFIVNQEQLLGIFPTKYLRLACTLILQEVIIFLVKTLNLRAFALSAEMRTVLATRHWSAVQRHCSESNFCQ